MLKDIVTVLIRFLAAFSAFGSSTYMLWQSGMNAVYGTQGLADLATYFLVAFLIVVIIAILLWRLSASIAGWLTRGLDHQADLPDPEGIVMAGSFLIGAYWVLTKIGSVSALLIHYMTYDPPFMGEDLVAHSSVLRLVDGYELLTFVVALLMMIGCKQVGALFRKLRTLGQQ